MQTGKIKPQEPTGLYTNFTLLPDFLRAKGYKTHMVGKWHLGFCNIDYVPTRRGFDTFYGFYNSVEDYFAHTRKASGDSVIMIRKCEHDVLPSQ